MKLEFKKIEDRLWRAIRPDGTEVGSIMMFKNAKGKEDILILGNKREKNVNGGSTISFDGVPKSEIDQIVDFADQLAVVEFGL